MQPSASSGYPCSSCHLGFFPLPYRFLLRWLLLTSSSMQKMSCFLHLHFCSRSLQTKTIFLNKKSYNLCFCSILLELLYDIDYVLFETSLLISGIIGFSFPFHLFDFACTSLLPLFFSHLHLRECLINQIEVGHSVPNVHFCIFKLLFSISPCMSHYRVKFSMHVSFFHYHPSPSTPRTHFSAQYSWISVSPSSQCLKFPPKPSVSSVILLEKCESKHSSTPV